MHRGQFADLDRVLAHYNAAPPAFPGHSDLLPLGLNTDELGQLRAFLLTLNSEPDAPEQLFQAPEG
jgi:cytochrome c peroxidase